MTNCTLKRKQKRHPIRISVDGSDVSGNGIDLLRAAGVRLDLCVAASRLLPDPRNSATMTPPWEALDRQRIDGEVPRS